MSMLATRCPDLLLNRCRIGRSKLPGAGLGLFASRDISAGELITLYPGDALLYWKNGREASSSRVCTGVVFGAHVPEEEKDAARVTTDSARQYEACATSTLSCVGDPRRDGDPAYLGHFANDGAMCDSSDGDQIMYREDSRAAANADHVTLEGCQLATQATRDIACGAEIYVSYGEGYWLSHLMSSLPTMQGAVDVDGGAQKRVQRRPALQPTNTPTSRKQKPLRKKKKRVQRRPDALQPTSTPTSREQKPLRVVPGTNDETPFSNMWCAPWFGLDETSPPTSRASLIGLDSAFIINDVITSAEAARMVAMAESMGFERSAAADKERRNGALSWVLHKEFEQQLLDRLAPHLPWTIHIHSPDTPAPSTAELQKRLPPSGGYPPWVRQVEGAPVGSYTLAGLSARSRVYRYESDGADAFLPHHDEVWPGTGLEMATDDSGPQLLTDRWQYSSAPRGQWAWSGGDRVSHISVLLYLSDDFAGGETLLHPDGERRAASSPRVAVTPVTGSALCFGQSFKLGRNGVSQSTDAILHEGMPLNAKDSRPLFLAPPAKYVLRTDIQYTMPYPPPGASPPSGCEILTSPGRLEDPQAAQSMTIELSTDSATRAKQLALLEEYGYDVSRYRLS